MNTTAESTGPHEAKLRLFLPPALLAEVHAYYDALQAAQAAPIDRAGHARATRSADKRALVLQAIANTRAWLEEHKPYERASHVLEHLEKNRKFYGYSKLPSRKYVKAMLKAQGL